MENLLAPAPAVVSNENTATIHSIIRDSFNDAKKQIHQSVSSFKDDLTTMYDKAGHCLNKVAIPSDIFLKDQAQIEAEFKQEAIKNSTTRLTSCIIPIEQALQSPMEENY